MTTPNQPSAGVRSQMALLAQEIDDHIEQTPPATLSWVLSCGGRSGRRNWRPKLAPNWAADREAFWPGHYDSEPRIWPSLVSGLKPVEDNPFAHPQLRPEICDNFDKRAAVCYSRPV